MASKITGISLSKAIGGLQAPPTARIRIGDMYVELIVPSATNPILRKRLASMGGPDKIAVLSSAMTFEDDDDGKLKKDNIRPIFEAFIVDWGAVGDGGQDCPLLDDDGAPFACTLDNAYLLFRETPGGLDVLLAIARAIGEMSASKADIQEREKNGSGGSPAPPISATVQPTRSGRKPGRAST